MIQVGDIVVRRDHHTPLRYRVRGIKPEHDWISVVIIRHDGHPDQRYRYGFTACLSDFEKAP